MLVEASKKQFRIVEPYICANAININGYPLSQYMVFEGVTLDMIVPRPTWMLNNGMSNEGSRHNIFYLDVYRSVEFKKRRCALLMERPADFCYYLSASKRENRLAILLPEGADLGVDSWSKIFHIIRTSPWATSQGVTDLTLITIALYEHWLYSLFDLKMLEEVDISGKIRPGDYITTAAKRLISSQKRGKEVVETAIFWRLQKQFEANGETIYGKVRSDVTFHEDKGGT